jgi:hypothetical protein
VVELPRKCTVFPYRGLDRTVRYMKVKVGREGRKDVFYVHSHDRRSEIMYAGRGGPEIPYRLPELHSMTGPIFVPESELSADKIIALGYRATANHSIRRANLVLLPDAPFILMPDYDEAGMLLAHHASRLLAADGRWTCKFFSPWLSMVRLRRGYGADNWIDDVGPDRAKETLARGIAELIPRGL